MVIILIYNLEHASSEVTHDSYGENCRKQTLILKYTVKKNLAVFPSPAGMSLIKLFLGGNNLVFPAQREFDQ
jgi:hypothetical protein